MKKVRFGIIGMGNMGRFHARYLLDGKVPRAELVAIADRSPEMAGLYPGVKVFATGEDLIRSGLVDAVLIATPHYLHTSLGIEALNQGLHVLVEKPISVHKADCDRLIAAHQRNDQVFGAMFQMRAEPRYCKIRQLIHSEELGQIVRFNWIITDWYRTEAYYSSGGWRATWKGEGGGVLLNQCPHNLDLIVWLLGRPSRVRGFCQLGRYHSIEVEDNVTAYLEWSTGATGVFVTSTGEAPGTNRLEICGDRGRLVLENNKITFTRNETSMFDFSRTATGGFTKPDVWHVDVPYDPAPGRHEVVVENFVAAILDGATLLAPARDGMHSVELANAILFSSLENRTIELPLDPAAYERKLQSLVANSTHEKKVVKTVAGDFSRSFNR